MKKLLMILIAMVLLVGCVPAGAQTTDTAAVDGIPAVLTFVNRGDIVATAGVYGADQEYTVVLLEEGTGIIRSDFLRPEGSEPYAAWTGYSMTTCTLYAYPSMVGESLKEIPAGQMLTVLDALDNCYYVQYGDDFGFLALSQITRWQPGNGSVGGKASNGDGANIPMSWQGGGSFALLRAVRQIASYTGTAAVRFDHMPVLLGFYQEGEKILLQGKVGTESGYYRVEMDGIAAFLRADYAAMQSGQVRKAYAAGTLTVYSACDLYGSSVRQLYRNAEVIVLAQFSDSCYIQLPDGQTGFAASEMLLDAPDYASQKNSGPWAEPIL